MLRWDPTRHSQRRKGYLIHQKKAKDAKTKEDGFLLKTFHK